jgi:N-acetylated-alpha-linked acidic dipeptidase
MRIRMDDRVRPIWTVTAKIVGSTLPRETVIVGNHRDAWVFGGVDPSSGSASLMDLARSLGELARDGAGPRRSILFASWDAEEFTLTSSTEWGEQHERMLKEEAVAYLNVDSSTSGSRLTASAVPSLNRFFLEAAAAVTDPGTRIPLPAAARERRAHERGSVSAGRRDDLVDNRLGSGSDYTVFLNYLGVPIVDMAFDGPYGVYHSMYDNHQWMSRIGDPGFRYHAAMTRLWGVMALRLANADVLPFDYRPYAARVREFLDEIEQRMNAEPAALGGADSDALFEPAREAATRFARAAALSASFAAQAASRRADRSTAELNRALMAAERALLDPSGIPGRPWYRHQIYAPKFTYAPEVLPGVAEAVDDGDLPRLRVQIASLARALDRAAAVLSAGSRPEP